MLTLAAAIGCGGDDLTLPNEGQPSAIEAVRGNRQNGTIGAALADSLVVQVRDRFRNPVPGVEVSWIAEGGGTVDPATSITDRDGRAGAQRILGEQPGVYTTVATAPALPDNPVVFTNTAVAATLSIVTQPSTSAAAGVPFDRQPVLQLLDQSAEPIGRAGVVVTVQIATGGGTLGGVTGVASDPDGVATFTNLSIRGSPGNRTLLFAADGFASAASAPVAVGVGAAASIAPVDGDDQSATVNTAVAVAPAVVVRDLDGNPVSGVPVEFSVTEGGGSLTGGTAATNAEGVARVGSWRLGTTAGENGLRALVEGADLDGSPVPFSATGTPGPVSGARSTMAASPGTIDASSGSAASTITVTARDQFENPVSGQSVTLSATGSGNTVIQPGQVTNGSGSTTGRLSATAAGARVVSARIGSIDVEGTVTVTVRAATPAASRSTASVGNGTAGSQTAITVELKDQFDNPAAGRAGAIAVQVTGANNATGDPAEDQGGGRYAVRYRPTTAGTDQIVVQVGGTSLPGGSLSSTVSPGPASPTESTAEVPSVWRVFSNPGPIPVRVSVRDAFGNLRAGLTDAVTVQVDGMTPALQATANGDGTYSVSFAPPRFGRVPVAVSVNGQAIAGSPFFVDISFF